MSDVSFQGAPNWRMLLTSYTTYLIPRDLLTN